MQKPLIHCSDTELNAMLDRTAFDISAVDKSNHDAKERLKGRQTEVRRVITERRELKEWEENLTAFTKALVEGITAINLNRKGNGPFAIELPEDKPKEYFFSLPGYPEVVGAISNKYGVHIEFQYTPGESNSYGSNFDSANAMVTFGHSYRTKREQATIHLLVQQINIP